MLSGVLLFTIVEKIFSGYANADENNPRKLLLMPFVSLSYLLFLARTKVRRDCILLTAEKWGSVA